MPIRVLGGESLKDLIDVTCHEYCGSAPDKPFACLLVLFDEFGRYAEFATMKRQIAGSGVLQHLFEGIQSNSDKACFVGFIQFELNTYVQRIAPEWCDSIKDLECNFAEMNSITTKEWRYQHVTSNLNILPNHIKFAAENWRNALSVSEPRGTIIYCYAVFKKASSPPLVATSQQCDHAAWIAKKAEQRCRALEVDWLVQRYSELPDVFKQIFLQKIEAP